MPMSWAAGLQPAKVTPGTAVILEKAGLMWIACRCRGSVAPWPGCLQIGTGCYCCSFSRTGSTSWKGDCCPWLPDNLPRDSLSEVDRLLLDRPS